MTNVMRQDVCSGNKNDNFSNMDVFIFLTGKYLTIYI